MSSTTYYQRKKNVILHKVKDYYEKIKKNWESKQKINIESYLKKKKTKRDNMEKTDIVIYLRKIKSKTISKTLLRG